ncbi:SIR2 family NAD-dependent protein deacylase [Glaciimonas soli]|uniref:SIR2 family protein n=1 Tax=Glaciimonas soli TaxID=2590999 RepID=A0A843YUB1_9BURK|nr:SIR2 family protein [Glaciimonas soli]MQR01088.1 SIR2 family protein [Glaciimonas soli]
MTAKNISEITDLPDYPSIQKLASALHNFNGNQRGAAIMIGAGFSRCAAFHVGHTKKMPLWNDFSKKLIEGLNSSDKELSFSDPLRIAEEYRIYFGQAALNDQIRTEINDDAWRAGELYQSLLNLPWSEVMTTNWDTLLERAAKNVHSRYYTSVTKPSDLAWAPSPRIVKLHGTIGSNDTFIAAQEDFRTYPAKFAPFVNFARQAFIENELCLLGFSGDDPNFLQWAGWVRDHLAEHARKIYLIGALNLTAARRKYLESINIAPIDLWDAVHNIEDSDRRHQTATALFLKEVKRIGESRVEKHKWAPTNLHRQQVSEDDFHRQFKEPEYAATLLKQQLAILKSDRESYPDWLVCPPDLLGRIQSQISDPRPTPQNISALAVEDRAKLLYEIVWRYDITLTSIPSWLTDVLFQFVNPDTPCSLSKHQQLEIALILLKNSRWLEAKNEEDKQAIQTHIKELTAILEKHVQHFPDCATELAYHQALVARDAFDYPNMESAAEKIVGDDPIWKLRRATLLMELGRSEEGIKIINMAYGELRENYRGDRDSISILSRFMWAHWLLQSIHSYHSNQRPEKLAAFIENITQEWKCDPWIWIEHIRGKVGQRQEEYFKNQHPIELTFEQGSYRDNSSHHSNNSGVSEFLQLEELSRCVGIPLRISSGFIGVSLLSNAAEKLVLSGGIGSELLNYILAIRSASNERSSSINALFTRIGVASASKNVVDTLVERTQLAITYWREQRTTGSKERQKHALSTLGIVIEVLARLVVRVPSGKAKIIFRLGLSLGQQKNLQCYDLFGVVASLLDNSLKSIPASEQGELLVDALAFPLPSEIIDQQALSRWHNISIQYPNERNAYRHVGIRIDELINAVKSDTSITRTAALLRLLPLVKKDDFLSQEENEKLAKAVWNDNLDYQTLPATSYLYPHVFLILPTLDEEQVRALVRHHLYEHGKEILMDTREKLRTFPSEEIHRATMVYSGMAHAASNEITQLFPTSKQATILFDRLMGWRDQEPEADDFFQEIRSANKLIDDIGNALSYAIVPALSKKKKTVKRFEQLQLLYEEVEKAFHVIPAFVFFVEANDDVANAVEKIIRKALQSNHANTVSYAALGIQKWAELSEEVEFPHLERLISRLIIIIESGRTTGLAALLDVANNLVKKQQLSKQHIATLIETIPSIFSAVSYVDIKSHSPEEVSASSIRAACVKLADVLLRQNKDAIALRNLLEESQSDALPEVRFAINSEEP